MINALSVPFKRRTVGEWGTMGERDVGE